MAQVLTPHGKVIGLILPPNIQPKDEDDAAVKAEADPVPEKKTRKPRNSAK